MSACPWESVRAASASDGRASRISPAVHGLADFVGIGRVSDPAVPAENPDLVDAGLVRHVSDDRIDVGGLVLQHGEARASGDDLGKLGDVTGDRVEQFGSLVPGDQQREQEHDAGEGQAEVKTDLEPEGSPTHGLLALSPLRARVFLGCHRSGRGAHTRWQLISEPRVGSTCRGSRQQCAFRLIRAACLGHGGGGVGILAFRAHRAVRSLRARRCDLPRISCECTRGIASLRSQ